MRGEYIWFWKTCTLSRELPPRARRIRVKRPDGDVYSGTTSACAENTAGSAFEGEQVNYLRVRGEYGTPGVGATPDMELPPRARRILMHPDIARTDIGTTSACAENTRRNVARFSEARNYLRVRGEYRNALSSQHSHKELPPRARRIHKKQFGDHVVYGTTSACAENTICSNMMAFPFWNYLRVRGEYNKCACDAVAVVELPPRARRIP
ncbi:Uncharacterised protein [Corynebacterium matruchotii]|uniref:Uncharacterized protein n=2 Tax=Corynebacterium matruchotii TaxID=43768 RepID=E0DCA7_9CORY|nr:hypothetical protein HMPREF0299_5956 [Corynebacterium matruchotii ATCC 14266]SPW24155.1 Uncharacterised protein [Corynebacterium matruchotii]